MAKPMKSATGEIGVHFSIAPIAPIPIEEMESDAAIREAAWQSFLAFARPSKEPGQGTGSVSPYGSREEWYDEMYDERSQ